MKTIVFEWDPRKASSNLRKHHISFAEAATVFQDPLARIFPDPDHSQVEDREIIIGSSTQLRLLLVSFKEIQPARVRIISARLTTRLEQRDYEEGTRQ